MSERNLKLTLQYIGTNYCGWQIQPNGPTVQQILQDLLGKMFQEKIVVMGAGRTDSGVHALAQVAHFKTRHEMDTATLLKALNSQLPDDIAVLSVEEVSREFHAMYGARSKTYSYFLLQSAEKLPLLTPYTWRIRGPLDVEAMACCLELIEGEHDFRSFCASDSSANSTVRTILQARLKRIRLQEFANRLLSMLGLEKVVPPVHCDASILALHFQGEGFLKHMVRNLVGTLVEVGRGKMTVQEFERILASRDRRQAGVTAPAGGLFMVRVDY